MELMARAVAERVDRREQIVTAATKVLSREGYENTSMKQIADEIGVASGLLHYYFGSKEELMAAVVQRMHDDVMAEWVAAMEATDDPLERVVAGLRASAARFEKEPEFWRLALDMYAVGQRNPTIGKRVKAMYDVVIRQVTEECEKIDAMLPMHSPLPMQSMAMTVAGALDGIAFQALACEADAREAFRALLALVLSYVAMAYVFAGEQPPLDRIAGYLAIEG